MAGYVIVNNEIMDEALHAEFRELAAATIEAHGGKYLVRGGAAEAIDGEWAPSHIVVIEFDSVKQAKAWLSSPGYAEAKKIRMRAAKASVIVVEGV